MVFCKTSRFSLLFSFLFVITWLISTNHCFSQFLELPSCLKEIPYANDSGLVKSEKLLDIHGVQSAYNSSLVETDSGYLLFFRQDLPHYQFRVGAARLDRNFNHLDEQCHFFQELENNCYDPRAFKINETIYLLLHLVKSDYKNLVLATINEKSLKVERIVRLYPQLLKDERNWTPLIPVSSNENSINFIYTFFPTVAGQINPLTGSITYNAPPQPIHRKEAPFWKWGTLSGGSPAIELDDMYVCFFHSHIRIPKHCYVMGACAFSKDPSHRLIGISQLPIVTRKMYESTYQGQMGPILYPKSAEALDRVIFPCGAVLTKDDQGTQIFVVSCGENDLNTRILVIDKKLLLKTLRSL